MSIDYELGGRIYRVFTPCRYINFPNHRKTDQIYLQPISGYTLFFNGDRLVVSYVAVYIDGSGACNIEFIAREPISFIKTKARSSIIYRLLVPFDFIFGRFLITDEFHKKYRVDGRVDFYVYQ